MFRIQSLRTKLVLVFALLALVPLAAMLFFGHFFTRSALSQQALDRSAHQVRLQAEGIVSALRQVHGDIIYLSELRALTMLRRQTDPAQIELWRREVAQDLLVLASTRPMYHALRILSQDGDERVGVRSGERLVEVITVPQNRRGTPYFYETLARAPGEIYVSPFEAQDGENAPYIHYALRLVDGVAVIDVEVGWLLRLLPTSNGDAWALIDQDGRLLVYPDGFVPPTDAQEIERMLDGQRGSVETSSSVYVYETIYPSAIDRSQYWVLIQQTPVGVLYASVNQFYLISILFIVGVAGVALVMARTTRRWLLAPIEALHQMTTRFGSDGKAPPLPDAPPTDEIGTLTWAFCEMAQELERKRKQEHRLIERLIRAQEEERKLVAYDLHDGLIQQMVGARFYLSNCRDRCPIDALDARSGIRKGCEALSEAIIEGRRIIEGLRPAALDDLGLVAAIEEIAQSNAAAAGWQLDLDLQPLTAEPPKTVAVTLYRIAQEALNNARKHAQAGRVRLALHNGVGIHLSIEDDGIGFSPSQLGGDEHGLGITTMHERAMLIHGVCTIRSAPGAGTQVEVVVPNSVPAQAAPEEVSRWRSAAGRSTS